MPEWYEELFDERYVAFYDVLGSGQTAEADVDFIERALDLEPGMAVLDLGCGQGRHAIPLAERGYQVTGVDLSEVMLERARQFAEARGARVDWQRRRMEALDGLGPFDAVLCLFTVLGYYGDDGDQKVLTRIHEVLRPGGQLMLDLSNYAGQLRRLPGETWRETSTGVTRERHAYDPTRGLIVTDRTLFQVEGGRMDLPRTEVRAYLPHEVLRMLRDVGFKPELLYGAYADEPFQWTTAEHQIHVARKGD
jgi:2-polyprenyl-3-methyl-5-hydroxy-6-metoxy-1,4-benzoquinol methylase